MGRKKKITPETRAVLNGQAREIGDGKRHLNLTIDERAALARRQKNEEVIACFLDLERDWTWAQIADTVGMSLSSLHRFTKDPEFVAAYDEALSHVGHDPRLRAAQGAIADIVPAAVRTLRRLVTGADVPEGVQLKAAQEILTRSGVGKLEPSDDPRELANFLDRTGVHVDGNLNVFQVNVSEDYRKAFRRFMGDGRTDSEDNVIDIVPVDTTAQDQVSSPPETHTETTPDQDP